MKRSILFMLLLLVGVAAYSQPRELTEEDKRKIAVLEQWCEQGDTEICEKLYFHYFLRGESEAENIIRIIETLSNQKKPRYMFMWGIALIEGGLGRQITKEDYQEGMKLISKAADQDYPPAQFLMGDYYSKSDNRVDINKAMFYFNCAYQSDYIPAIRVIKVLDYDLFVIPDAAFRDRLWKAIDESGDPYKEVGSDKKERAEIKRRKFIN